MTLYSVRDWNIKYENNRTRELKKLDWVPVPNKQDGDGYTELMAYEDGPSLYGAWNAIVQLASKCKPRGVLIRENKTPHTAQSIARIVRFPDGIIIRSLVILVDPIGWLDAVPHEIPHLGATLDADTPPPPNRFEGKGREGKEGKDAPAPLRGEIPSEKEAVGMTVNAGIPEAFTLMVYEMWASRSGKDGSGVAVDWLRYVTRRWKNECVDWRAGTHRGQKGAMQTTSEDWRSSL